jgi:lipoprotein-anchoring transpeptidase ErfK/SrfK
MPFVLTNSFVNNHLRPGLWVALSSGMNNTQTQWMKLVAVLAIAAVDAYAEERRTKGDRIVISVSDHKLVLFSGDQVLKIYDVAVGKSSTPSPKGEFKIVNHVKNPTWYGPNTVVPPGKNNPLGTRWMGLSAKGYGIHGTNVPSSIGKSASHGCIRMRQADLEELFDLVDVGVTVELRGDRPQFLAETFAARSL